MCIRLAYGFLLVMSTQKCSQAVRACDRQYMQRCDTCTIGSRCKSKLITEEMLYVADHCKELCERHTSCQAAEYHPVNSSCKMYECTLMHITKGYTSVVFRKSCSQDCSKFRLKLQNLRNSSMSVCTLADLGRISNQDCMAKCFDTEDCRALVYPKDSYDCLLCSSSEEKSLDVLVTEFDETRLMRRICITDEPKNYTQTCLNCDKGNLCQDSFEELVAYNESSCKDECKNNADCGQSVYDSGGNTCKLYDCGLVRENTDTMVYRRVSANDCSEFEISILNGYDGTCSILTVLMPVPMFEYCVDKCLDMPGCRGATYINGARCKLHGCDSYNQSIPDSFFMKRKCIDSTAQQSHSTLYHSNRSTSQTSDLNCTITTQNKPTSEEQNELFGDQLHKVVASSVSGFIAITCVGPLILYCLVCRKKRIKPCSSGK